MGMVAKAVATPTAAAAEAAEAEEAVEEARTLEDAAPEAEARVLPLPTANLSSHGFVAGPRVDAVGVADVLTIPLCRVPIRVARAGTALCLSAPTLEAGSFPPCRLLDGSRSLAPFPGPAMLGVSA